MNLNANVPYVKIYDENRVVTNPIVKSYVSYGSNRRERRAKEPRHLTNRKSWQMICVGTHRYNKNVQIVFNKKEQRFVRINHLFLA